MYILEIALKVYIDLKKGLKENCVKDQAAQATLDATPDTPDTLPLTIKFTQLGMEYKFPSAKELNSDPMALLNCMDPETAAQLPRPLFGDYKQPFDIKEFYFNASKIRLYSFTTLVKYVVIFYNASKMRLSIF